VIDFCGAEMGVIVKYSKKGTIIVECRAFGEPEGLRDSESVAVEIVISDNGCGISRSKLESIFREFEQVESTASKTDTGPGLGGL
jgi:signal transduction histidine kinase